MDARKFLELFITESREHAESIARGARELTPSSPPDLIHELFRSFHSIKGMALTMEFRELAELAHGIEDVFDQVRKGARAMDAAVIELTLDVADRLHAQIDEIAVGGRNRSNEDLTQRASALLAGAPAPPLPASAPAASEPRASSDPDGMIMKVQFEVATGAPLPAARAMVALKRLQTLGAVVSCNPDPLRWAEEAFAGEVVVDLRTATEPAVISHEISALPDIGACRIVAAGGDRGAASPAPRQQTSSTLRVRTEILDRLMDGVGELLVAAGAVGERLPRAPGADQALQRLRRAIARMHDDVLQMRMVPFDWIAQRFHQSVRNLAQNLGKAVELTIQGAEVQMDRSVLEELVDPINHMLRNSIDHGLEPPAERRSGGKLETGRVLLALERDAEVVRIRLSDDGRGMDPARIREAAVRKGFATEEQVRALSEEEALMLTTIPGFSTADRLSEVSGRGVGMDVVRTRIESLGGHMRIVSRPGRGTEIRMDLPLTVAVIDSLLLRLGADLYAVPVHAVKKTLQVEPSEVQYSGGEAMLRRGEDTVHLRNLSALLGEGAGAVWDRSLCAVLYEDEGRTYGLGVDSVAGKRPIVVKPLKAPLENLREYSGATVLQDGRIALILDLVNLARA
jgi:two-component system chemotaxis sensor kinase CheA